VGRRRRVLVPGWARTCRIDSVAWDAPGRSPEADGQALLGCLPPGGGPVSSEVVRSQLGGDEERYAATCRRLENQGYLLTGQGRGETVRRDLTAVRPEFRLACGRPGAHVMVRQVPVTVPRPVCALAGVALSSPGRGGRRPSPGAPVGIGNSRGFRRSVDPVPLDVSIEITGTAANARAQPLRQRQQQPALAEIHQFICATAADLRESNQPGRSAGMRAWTQPKADHVAWSSLNFRRRWAL
jgi:hypothetical protein